MVKRAFSKYLPGLKHVVVVGGKVFFFPALIYITIYYIFQPQYIFTFSRSFFIDSGDGYQNIWNIWWVNHALEHAQNPYFTTVLHWPYGTTLIPQTMSIYNGIVGFGLIHIFDFSLVQTVNFAVVFSFVMSGVTMFWFIRKLFGRQWVALVAGGLYTFSSYHFAHAIGHLQLISFEWVPLFFLAFWTLLEKMRYRYAFFATGSLFLVLLCDYYYLFWCVVVGSMWFGWKAWRHEVHFDRRTASVLGVFVVSSLILVGPLVYALLRINKVDPLTGVHDPTIFGMNPICIFLPGGTWHWSTLTERIWIHLRYRAETSLFFGYGLLTVLAIAFYNMRYRARKFKVPAFLVFWWIVLAVFGVLALGPHPNLFGVDRTIPLPYFFLQKIFPALAISGMPIRWVLIALIAAIVIVSYMLTRLDLNRRRDVYLAVLFVLVSFIDLWPNASPLTSQAVPKYVYYLHRLAYGAVIDNATDSEPQQLRNQTITEKPIAFGYVTRLPRSVAEKDTGITGMLERNQYAELCMTAHIRYITTPASRPLTTDFPVIYNDGLALIYDLHQVGGC
jgi:hypothetical protein